MPSLILGPLLRFIGPTEATVWVETDGQCEIEILGTTSRTFCVAGHHYALLVLAGLEPGNRYEYSVALDGTVAWPERGGSHGVINTPKRDDKLRLAFGTCRVSLPHEPPFTLTKDQDDRGHEVDSLAALQVSMEDEPEDEWPEALLMIGDQVYADEVSLGVASRIASRRSTDEGAGEEIADFEEYTWLYHESWGDPAIRWLLSSLPSAMIFDDHDVCDDWNTSGAWAMEQRQKPWWRERLLGAYMSYWLYQHIGNLSPSEIQENELLAELQSIEGDGEEIMRRFAGMAADEVASTRWSYRRDFGRTRLVVLDSRAGRIIDDDSNRQMLSDEQWEWVSEQLTGDIDHLIVASSLPVLMAPGLHHLEAWNEALCAGAWGKLAVDPSENLRRAVDLEHWPAFGKCFDRLLGELRDAGSGKRGKAPASIVLLSGDVHHAYVAEAQFPDEHMVTSGLVQAVCSPMRNPLDSRERHIMKAALSKPGIALARLLSRAAKVPPPGLRWRFIEDPTFDNQIGTVEIEERHCSIRIDKTKPEDWQRPGLHRSFEHQVS